MTLRKITVDNSFRYVSNSQSNFSRKDHKPKTASPPKKQNKKFSQRNKKFIQVMTGEGFRIIQWTYIKNKKYTDTLIEQTKTKPQETLEFKPNKPKETLV